MENWFKDKLELKDKANGGARFNRIPLSKIDSGDTENGFTIFTFSNGWGFGRFSVSK